jgi:hypothetical protein
MRYHEIHRSSTESFNESWLFELPQRLYQPDTLYRQFVSDVDDYVKSVPQNVYKLGGGWFKYEGSQVAYYWFEQGQEIILGGAFEQKSQSTIVDYVVKNPNDKNKPPYASDLYELVLKDQSKPLGIESDKFLSDSGFKIWSKLLSMGHKINVYDKLQPGMTFKDITDLDDLKNYFGDDKSFQNYRFVLSENNASHAELRISRFGRRKYREENNLPLD